VLGKSRGGCTSKLHALADAKGRPCALILTAGNINDITLAASLLDRVGPLRRHLADRAYDANHLRDRLAAQNTEAVIPSTTSRSQPIPYDRRAYKAQKPDRALMVQAQGLVPHRNPRRQARRKRPRLLRLTELTNVKAVPAYRLSNRTAAQERAGNGDGVWNVRER